ncbi:DNA polymerase III subunit beta [Sanguibacteroides justesenii]|uniref:DNA polymerase III subunit beta n=1 Tax=Porphyromonadaceae TaxID=171551 RepID=UPI00073E2C2A|nr:MULTISPECIES: DNA polymerase III subunit beta [Porphyromonadaceae]PXZ43962.1 DNA polymerase III subunit beta [Sanguibacteroides justesenii]
MKFVISSSTFLSRLQAVSRVISGKPAQPILDNILLVAKDNRLYVTASDKETTMEARVELEQLEIPGSITIPAKLLLDILKEFPEQPLTFDINEATHKVTIISDKGEFSVMGESAEDYPVQSGLDENSVALVTNCGMLLEGISKTVFATANDDLRPVMNCILIEMNAENFTFVASDAHKLVRYKRFDARTDGEQRALILPKKPSLLLKNILPKDDSELKMQFNEKMACFIFGDYKMICTLVEGRFPNYNSVIPQNNPKKIIIEKKELYNTLRRVSVMANQASNLVKFDLTRGSMVISAQDVDYAMSGHETISCQYDGEEMAIGFKSPFVLEILANLNTEYFVLELSDPSRPGLFLPYESDNQDEDLLMLLMPMMV